MIKYYGEMWPSQSHLLSPLLEAARGPKGKKKLWNGALESFFQKINCMVYSEMLLSYPDWKLTFTVHTDEYDK